MSSQKESGACWHLLLAFIRKDAAQEEPGFPEARKCRSVDSNSATYVQPQYLACHRKNNSSKTAVHFGTVGRYNYRTVPKYSIVVPFHNEEENVTELYDRLKVVMEATGEPFELVFVDDGSRDHTFWMLQQIAAVDRRVVVVKLRRNFGQTSALAAGFDHAEGEYVIAMDGDLQHDPHDIPLFLQKLREGYDIVSGWRKQRIDNFVMRRIPSKIANWLMAKLSGVELHDFGTTFKAYRRGVVQEIPLYGELHRFIPALASAYGATICEIPIRNVNRERGESHYGISRTFRVFFDLITIRFLLKYMARPLHFFGTVGALEFAGWLRDRLVDALRQVCSRSQRNG